MTLRFRQAPKLPENPYEIKFETWYRLDPEHRNEKSFYGKAKIAFRRLTRYEIVAVLKSYETEIATCDELGMAEKTACKTLWGETIERKLSRTSSRHFSEFKLRATEIADTISKLMELKLGSKSLVL